MGKVVTILCCLLSLQTMSQRETAITYFNRIIALKNKIIDEMKIIIDARDKQIAEYKKQIANLSKNKINDQKLQDAIQELHFANLQLKKIQEEARLLKDSISAMEIEHTVLSLKIEELTKEIQELREKEEEYEKSLSDFLQSQGREKIYKKARQRATLDFNAGKESTETDRIEDRDELIFVSGGYQFLNGIIIEMIYGWTISSSKSIVLGAGIGLDYLFDENTSSIPAFISAKVALPEGFINYSEGKKITNYDIWIASVNAGYAFLVQSYDKLVSRSGPFCNIGVSYSTYGGNDVAITPELTYKMQSLRKEGKDEIFENTLKHTICFKIGLVVYLRR